MLKKLYSGIIALVAFVQVQAQSPSSSDSLHKRCGVTKALRAAMEIPAPPYSPFAALVPPASYPPSAIEVCGHFTIYYEDIRLGLDTGYNKSAGVGPMRRSNLCQVLQYVESVIDFSSVPPGGIKLLVDFSDNYSGLGSVGLPFFRMLPGLHPTIDGYVNSYIRTGLDPAPSGFHGMIGMDFRPATPGFIAQPTNNDYSVTAACGIDLAAMELHHLSHVLGMFSFVDQTPTGTYITSGPFTSLDRAVHTTPNPATSTDPFGPGNLFPFVSSGFSFTPSTGATDRLFWIDGTQPPYNHGLMQADTINSGVWHFLGNGSLYGRQARISPGDYQDYVSLPHEMFQAVPMRRAFTKGELELLTGTLGYSYNPSFATTHATEIANHIPWCSKMASNTYNHIYNLPEGPEILPADYTITNNTGTSLVIDLTTDTTLKDADGDPLTIYPGSLVNFRGCGIGGNNHDALSVNGAGNQITYTPRANFYGRAQLGYNLYDGIEKGGFVVITVDVRKGTNVTIPAGENLVLNGSFEEGAEVRTIGTATTETVNNSINLSFDHAFRLGLHFGDSHPYDFLKLLSGTVQVHNSNDNGWCLTATKRIFGTLSGTFPAPWWLPGVDMPYPPFVADKRYRGMGNPGLLMYLGENMQQCKRYALEFYARRTYNSGIAYPAKEDIKFGFTDDAHMQASTWAGKIENVDLTWSPTSTVPAEHAFTTGEWQKVKISFTYCDTTAANILYLDVFDWFGPLVDPGFSPPPLIIDSVSLKEVDFGVDIAITYPGGCDRTLVANPGEIASYGCNSILYTWTDMSGTVLGTGKELTVSAMVLKTYIVTADDGCGHTAADTIDVAPCRCAPGEVLGTASFTTLSGTVPSTLSPGLYYAATDLTVSGTTTFNNAILLMEPDVAIDVSNTAKLILDTTHIFTCPDTNRLWTGIRLQSSGGNSGRIEIKNGSLIEDAYFGIDAHNLKVPPSGNIIDITNSTFNRNMVSVSVDGAYTLGSAGTYPIRIENSLFTARHFDTMAGYPFVWAPNVRLREELTSVSNTKAPYKISRDYAKAYLKNDTMAYLGIQFYNTGNTLVPGSSYAEVLIGEPNFAWNRNIIDNMQYGFHSNNSNTVLVNTHIINIGKRMVPDDDTNHSYATADGMGIIGQCNSIRSNRVKIGAGANAGVKLYDCYFGVFMQDVADVEIKAVAISSSHTLGDKTVPGSDRSTDWYSGQGITMIGHKNHLKWSVTQDTISNINHGMYMYIGNPVAGATTEIKNNMFYDQNRSARFTGLTGLQYMLQGMTVQGSGISSSNTVSIKDNTLAGVFNGIELNNLKSAVATVENNQLQLTDKTMSTIGTPQYGISALYCQDATISANTVSTTTLGVLIYARNMKGFYASKNTNLRFCGNFTNRIGSAFVFDGTDAQVGTRWIANTINDGWRGMTLASDIGDQGFMYDWRVVPTGTFYGPTLNKWNGYGGTKVQTMTVYPTNTMLSKLYVKNVTTGTAERPTANESDIGALFPYLYRYSLSPTESIRVPNGPPSDANCHGALYEQQTFPRPELSGPFVTIKALGRLVINDSLGYDSTYRVNQWSNQLAVFELATLHPELRDSSGTLDTFMIHATASRFGWLTAINQAVATGNIATAQSLINTPVSAMGRVVVNCNVTITDYPAANGIVSDYVTYYNTHIRMLQNTITPTDTAIIGAIARKCPPVDGAVVYKARALYQLLTGLTVQYKDDSCAYGFGGHSLFRIAPEEVIAGSSEQDYILFPNPNEGAFSIRQIIPSDKIVEAKIYNALGQELHRETVHFRGGVLNFRLDNAMPGLYLVCITDENHKVVCLKFNVK